METRNISITLNKAKEWYNSNNSSLKEVALQAFTKEELNPFDFTKIKTFEDACRALNLDFEDCLIELNTIERFSKASVASFALNIIRKALNKGQTMDLLEGEIWYPYTPFILEEKLYMHKKRDYGQEVEQFLYQNNLYSLMGGCALFNSDSGIGQFRQYHGIGSSNASFGFLGCATKEIAQHFGKYFAKEIFDAKYGDLIEYEWL